MRMTGWLGAVSALVLLTASPGCAAGAKGRELTTLTGTVRVVGSEPFTQVVLTVGEGSGPEAEMRDYALTGPLAEELARHHQYEKVSLDGTACTPPSPRFSRCFSPVRITIIGR